MGLAVYNGINLDIHLPPICYHKLLTPAVVPYNDVKAVVGVRPVTIDDLGQVSPVGYLLLLSRRVICLRWNATLRHVRISVLSDVLIVASNVFYFIPFSLSLLEHSSRKSA